MDIAFLIGYLKVLIKELWAKRLWVVGGAGGFMLVVLLVGLRWPVSFETSATVYADNQNILRPLLSNQATVTKVQNQTRVVRERITSPRLLRDVVGELYGENLSPQEIEEYSGKIRGRLSIIGLGSNHIKISYKSSQAREAFQTLNQIVETFIRDSADTKRAQSKEAFLFIDNQVRQYKQQLVDAEERLKKFNEDNNDGNDATVTARIASLRAAIEEMNIAQDEMLGSISSLKNQLKNESAFSNKRYKSEAYRERLTELEGRLDNMLLTFKEDYPDVVALKLQIEDVKQTIIEADSKQREKKTSDDDQLLVNPIYQELRSKLAEAEVDYDARKRRLNATEELLQQEYERRKRVAGRQAEYSELVRDYNVIKTKYEEMLTKKENARLSMTIALEGQGVTFKIQEPAVYPLTPIGLRFLHFALLAPILAAFFPVGVILLYVLIDQRIRRQEQIQDVTDVPVLAVVESLDTSESLRQDRNKNMVMILMMILVAVSYLSIMVIKKMGII